MQKERIFPALIIQPEALRNVVHDRRWKNVDTGELGVKHINDERILPAGIYVTARSYTN